MAARAVWDRGGYTAPRSPHHSQHTTSDTCRTGEPVTHSLIRNLKLVKAAKIVRIFSEQRSEAALIRETDAHRAQAHRANYSKIFLGPP